MSLEQINEEVLPELKEKKKRTGEKSEINRKKFQTGVKNNKNIGQDIIKKSLKNRRLKVWK